MNVTQLFVCILVIILIVSNCKKIKKYINQHRLSWQFDYGTTFMNAVKSMLSGDTERVFNFFKTLCKAYEKPNKIWLGSNLIVCISRPDHIEAVASKMLKKEIFNQYFRDILGYGLVTAPHNLWKVHRRQLTPGFNQKLLNSYVVAFSEKSEITLTKLENNISEPNVDIFKIMCEYSMETLFETIFGLKFDAAKYNASMSEINEWFTFLIHAQATRQFTLYNRIDFIYTLLYKSLANRCKEVTVKANNLMELIIYDKKKQHQQFKKHHNEEYDNQLKSLLDILVELSEEEKCYSDIELRDEVYTFVMAGTHTSGITMSFVLVMLALYKNIQDNVFEEITEVIGLTRKVEYTDLTHFKLLDRVIKETMRLFPIAPHLMRTIDENFKLPTGEILPEGCSVMMSLINVHLWDKIYPNPTQFDPDRFLPEECEKRPPFSYIPFSLGPRNCIAWKYALMSMTTVIATIVRKYNVNTHYNSIEEIRLKQEIFLEPVEGFKVYFSKR